MPRRAAQPSRQQQAFESLLDQEYAAAHTSSTGNNANRGRARGERRGRQSKQALVDKRDSDRLPGFAWRDSLHSDHGAYLPSPALEQLHSMFGNVIDNRGISAVLSECSNSVEAAIEMLLAVSERNQPQAPSKSSPAQSANCQGTPATAYTLSFRTRIRSSVLTDELEHYLQACYLGPATGAGSQKNAKGSY